MAFYFQRTCKITEFGLCRQDRAALIALPGKESTFLKWIRDFILGEAQGAFKNPQMQHVKQSILIGLEHWEVFPATFSSQNSQQN